jgi:magnesium chelatase accessory protein
MGGRLDWDTDGMEWPHRSSSSFVRAGGVTWHVQQMGSGPSIVLIHGTASSLHTWAAVAPIMAGTLSLTMFDLPGHGFTDPVPSDRMTLDAIAARVAELIDYLAIEPEIIVGHSAGASIAAQLVCDGQIIPPRGIISINGALLPFSGAAAWLYPAAARLLSATGIPARLFSRRAAEVGTIERVIGSTGSRLSPPGMSFYRRLFRSEAHVQAALDMMSRWELTRLVDRLSRVELPVHLIACSEDLAVPADQAFRLREMLPYSKVHYLRGCGHLAHEEAPERLAEFVMGLCCDMLGENGVTSRQVAL